MKAGHSGKAGVESKQQVEAFGRPDFADNDARRPHPQRLFDERSEVDLSGALESGLAGLHTDPIRVAALKLKDFLDRDQPLSPRDRSCQTVEKGSFLQHGANDANSSWRFARTGRRDAGAGRAATFRPIRVQSQPNHQKIDVHHAGLVRCSHTPNTAGDD